MNTILLIFVTSIGLYALLEMFLKWRGETTARSILQKIQNKEYKSTGPESLENEKLGIVSIANESIELSDYKKGKLISIPIKRISKIEAYKRDLLTTDLICLCIHGQESSFEIHEEMQGFNVAQESLASEFGLLQTGWNINITFPAFATNHTVLYRGD